MQSVNYLQFLPEITRRIVSTSHPEQVILFGSYARGDHHPDSDLDLLVIMKHVGSPRSESNRLRRALRGLLVPVDVIVATTEQLDRYRNTIGFIYQTALDEGKVVYDRSQTG
jgi:predicted nucleotidyltransferase